MAYPFFVPDHFIVSPPEEHLENGLVKYLVVRGDDVQSFSYQYVQDSLLLQYLKRRFHDKVLDKLMVVCFLPRGRSDWKYVMDVLKRGVCLDGACYRFLGHSEYQLKEKTCFLINYSDLVIYDTLARFIDFTHVRNPLRRADAVNLLFRGFDTTLSLDEKEFNEIPDVQKGRHSFTAGCGFMSEQFASEIQLAEQLHFVPSAVLVVYQGSCGVLVTRTDLRESKIEFRESMRKFTIADSELREKLNTFAVLDYSRPYTNGYLNVQSVMLLADRGVSHDYLKQLQEDYYIMLDNLCTNRSRAAYFLRTTGNTDQLRILQVTGLKGIQRELEKLREVEIENMRQCDKIEGGRNLPNPYYGVKTNLRILVPKSRIVYGVCDPYEKLKYGQCCFNPTMSEEEDGEFEEVDKVVVMRYPSYSPGDVLILEVQKDLPEYAHLRDCVVFPVRGGSPHALECGGGGLDGDKFFITWDRNLIPENKVTPHDYGPGPLDHVGSRISVSFDETFGGFGDRVCQQVREILPYIFGSVEGHKRRMKINTMQELGEYFAEYIPDLYYKFDSIYMSYASTIGPSSNECRKLHKLYAEVLAGVGNKEDFQKSLEKYEDQYAVLKEFGVQEASLPSQAVQGLLVHTGLSKAPFQRGDDVWEKMERRAREFLDHCYFNSHQ